MDATFPAVTICLASSSSPDFLLNLLLKVFRVISERHLRLLALGDINEYTILFAEYCLLRLDGESN